ncbi:hypothetical protein L1D12_19885 [Vibrio parahaemolyticus]|uniref:hypothetical protein n=1 Tax=Vibrio parahaemolyticus TaxID=670 RepID=UPI001EFD337C|nr:hypothetical protein [Vibrio parahaemolyticus]EJS4013481.1 hypothetical protein [Vibrio parahaemolyticus]MCG9637519.1 hypothetical protein [Vibrio parahaemolyticus]
MEHTTNNLNTLWHHMNTPHSSLLLESRDLWFNKKQVVLDGYRFTNCRFDGCELFVQSTNFELENCYIDATTVIKYGDGVSRVIKLFNKDNIWMKSSMPHFTATHNDDGTITIK